MRLSDFDYTLPEELIAQDPLPERDKSRLLVVDRSNGTLEHRRFEDILEYLQDDDLLVMNNTRVVAVRLYGRKSTGGAVEALVMKRVEPGVWRAMVKPGRRVHVGAELEFDNGLRASVIERTEEGGRILRFSCENAEHFRSLRGEADSAATCGARSLIGDSCQNAQSDPDEIITQMGEVPLPPYIHKQLADSERYQTVYAAQDGSAAAPTAGLHFTEGLLNKIRARGIKTAFVTLHVGVATFRPVRTENLDEHDMHTEAYSIDEECAEAVNSAKGRIICVGTTTVRALESAAVGKHKVAPISAETKLFIRPPYDFQIADGMVTNFHIPKSTLLMLVSAFSGVDLIKRAYSEAVARKYRFLSFGDAMFLY